MKSSTALEWHEEPRNNTSTHEMPEGSPEAPIISRRDLHSRHPKFWFDDGGIVIRVEHIIFRLHASTLRSKSEFFNDLFAQREGVDMEKVDGCPLFDLDGKSRDFTALLDALYGDLTILVGSVPSFFTLACLLRASHHWKFPGLRAWALDALHKRWPPSLESVDEHKDLDIHALKVIVLLRECGEKSLLKRAFYRLLRLKNLGMTFEPDITVGKCATVVTPPAEDGYSHEPIRWLPTDSKLGHNDTLRAIMLQAHAVDAWMAFVCKPPSYSFLSDLHQGKKVNCQQALSTAWSKRVTEAQNIRWSDPLGCWLAVTGILRKIEGLCDNCIVKCCEHLRNDRKSFWDGLDKILEI